MMMWCEIVFGIKQSQLGRVYIRRRLAFERKRLRQPRCPDALLILGDRVVLKNTCVILTSELNALCCPVCFFFHNNQNSRHHLLLIHMFYFIILLIIFIEMITRIPIAMTLKEYNQQLTMHRRQKHEQRWKRVSSPGFVIKRISCFTFLQMQIQNLWTLLPFQTQIDHYMRFDLDLHLLLHTSRQL